MKKIIIAVVLIILIAGGVSFFFVRKAENKKQALTLYGNVDIRDVNLGFRVSGRIEKLNFEEGDRVKKGDIMAVLDKEPFEVDLAIAKADMSKIKAKLANAEITYKRNARLVEKNSVSQQVYDESKYALEQCLAEEVSAKGLINKSEIKLKDTEILAPNNGTVLTRVCEVGTIIEAGSIVYTLALDNPVWIRTYVSEPDLGHIHPGQTVTVLTDSGGKYKGQVGFISPQAEFTPKNVETTQLRTDLVYRLRVIINSPDNGLRQGMPVTVKVQE